MNECKDCRHYRPDTVLLFHRHKFARCVATRYSYYARIDRKYAPPVSCGPDAAYFEPIPLGKSHGVDWDRAAKTAATLAEMREFCAKMPGAKVAFSNWRPFMLMEWRVTIAPRARFTIAEYLAALTTDYCAQDAAE